MATITVDAHEFKNAAAALEAKKFRRLADQTIGAVLVQSANIVRRSTRARLRPHRRSGKLASHIEYAKRGQGLDMEVTIRAASPIAHLLTGGVQPHEIRAGYVSKFGSKGNLTGGAHPPQAMTVRGGGSTNSAYAGVGSRAIRGAGADVLALRRIVHHPGNAPVPFFEEGVKDSEPEIQARMDKGVATMKRNLDFALSGRGGKT